MECIVQMQSSSRFQIVSGHETHVNTRCKCQIHVLDFGRRACICLCFSGKRTLASCLLRPNRTATRELKFQPVPWLCVLGPFQGSEVTLVRHVCGRGSQSGGPCLPQYVRQKISFFFLLCHCVSKETLPRVLNPGVCVDALFALINARCPSTVPPSLVGDPCILRTCVGVHARELVRACVSTSICLDEWNPRGPTRLDSGY